MATIREMFSRRRRAGDVGIEIEAEGSSEFPYSDLPGNWVAKPDGSLRGHSVEYVTDGPIPIKKARKTIDALKVKVARHGVTVHNSFRAGVHVHVNVQELDTDEVLRFAILYICFEPTLLKFCGSQRVGNHFCLRAKDAEYVIHALEHAAQLNDWYALRTDNIRYASMNLNAITRYGSIEFRAMETRSDFSKIADWAEILVALRDYAVSMPDKASLAESMSGLGPSQYLRKIIGDELADKVVHEGTDRECMDSMRLCQDLIFM